MPDPTKARRRLTAEDLDSLQGAIENERRHLTADADDESGIHVHVHTGGALTVDKAANTDKTGKDNDGDERMSKFEKTLDTLSTSVTQIGEAVKAMASGRHATKDGDSPAGTESTATADAAAAAAAAKEAETKALTEDSAALSNSWQDLVSKAEVLVPGFSMPTFDSKQLRKLTVDSMCSTRRKVIEQYAATEAGKAAVATMTGDQALADMDCAAVAVLFNAASAAKATANNARATHDSHQVPGKAVVQAMVTPQAINAANRSFWQRLNT